MVGFIGGLVSGFIGSGGAFVLTPAMMSMGVPDIIAVASNICHKFPKALVGAIKRAKYGQVDVKLGLVVGLSAEAGVLKVARQAAASNVACETEVIQAGEIFQEIVNQAADMQADLIIMGRRSRHGLARLMLGDITARVIGHAHCSVLVIPRAAEISGRHFVIASDGSRFGDTAAATAGKLALLCKTPTTVVSVTSPSHSEQRREEARQAINRITSFMAIEGVSADSRLLEGRPDEKIVEVANTTGADLIVVGSHGRTGLERVLLGSVTERVLNITPCAVLVVRST